MMEVAKTILISLTVYILLAAFNGVNDATRQVDRVLWEESVEKSLLEQNAQYNEQIYQRYSKLSGDLTNYQINIMQRVRALEERVRLLEEKHTGEK